MIILGYRHGMRASEICGLLWQDVDISARLITVRRLKNSLTTVQLLSDVEIKLLSGHSKTSEFVFQAPRASAGGGHAHMPTITFWRHFKAACRAAGISNRTPHSLKHGLGRALVAANVSLPVIQRALGHKSINSTAVYTAIDDETAGKILMEVLP
jgi:type 1 fimbriae regulatory protein FimE